MSEFPHPPEHMAEILPFRKRRRNPETLNPETYSDSEIVAYALAQWKHPSTPAHSVAEHIARLELNDDEETWSQRLQTALENQSIPDDLYDHLSAEHPTFQDMQRFIKVMTDRDELEKLALERKATRTLLDIYSMAVTDETGRVKAKDVTEVFRKMIRGIDAP